MDCQSPLGQQGSSVQAHVRAQFDRQAAHYLQGSPMADRQLLELICRMASPNPTQRVLDVACGAGFLVCEFAKGARFVCGIDLAERMLAEACKLARAQPQANTVFCQADAEVLPFSGEAFDIVSCKLALHYFPHPEIALGEMRRVATRVGRVVLIDRISSEDPARCAYQNRIEKLRTPAKTRVYNESELVALLDRTGLAVEQRAMYPEVMGVDAWIRAAGPDEATALTIRAMLTRGGDPAGLDVQGEGDLMLLTHQTCILVASRR